MAAKGSSWVDTAGTRGRLRGAEPPAPSCSPQSHRPHRAPAPHTASPRPPCPVPSCPSPGPQGPLTHLSRASGQPPACGCPCGAQGRAGSRAGRQQGSPSCSLGGTGTPAPHGTGAEHPPACSAPAAEVSGAAVPAGCRASCGAEQGPQITPGYPSLPQLNTQAGGTGESSCAGDRRGTGIPASPVSTVKLHVQVSATGVAAGAPHHGAASAIHAHPQHRRHGQVTHAELDGALVLAGDRAGEHRDGSGPEPP